MIAPGRALTDWLDSLSTDERNALGRRYAKVSASGGATMLRPNGEAVPIPPLLTPEVLSDDALAAVEASSHRLVAGLSHVSRWLMTDDERGRPLRDRLFRSFGPFEQQALDATWREAERLATVRVDFLVDQDERTRALEVNSTIPAMQGYSDIVAGAFLHEVGRARGLDRARCDALLDENGRNADGLLDSLLAHHRLLDRLLGTQRPDFGERRSLRIAIVAREGDSQTGELRHLARRFSDRSHPTVLVTPAQVHLINGPNGPELLISDGDDHFIPDLVYRHVFARRLDPASDFARALLDPRRHRILNPVASHLEVKGMLGLLSEAAASDDEHGLGAAIALDEATRAEVRRVVPWTRVLSHDPCRGPDGERIADLVETVAAEGDRFVLKKSWDYGGRSVFLGFDHDDRAAARALEVLGPTRFANRPPSWPELAAAAATDESDVWVVQERVRAGKRRHLVVGDGTSDVQWRDLYVDLSCYTNLGVDERPRGGVCRAALGLIVNLQGGGGMAPLLRESVIAGLMR